MGAQQEMLGQVGESPQEAFGSLEEDARSLPQASRHQTCQVHEEQALQSRVLCSPKSSHRSLQEVEGCSQEAHEKQEVEAQVLPQALLQAGSSYEAQVEEGHCMPQEQEVQ